MSAAAEILFQVRSGLGLVTLNRPEALNALTIDMIDSLRETLDDWAGRAEVRAVVVGGAGERAFCAGGDIRALFDQGKAGGELTSRFYREEYRLNRTIFRYPKPYVALMDGIAMGGGVGVSVHGSHRVATERTVFAMPETGIGFFPDVGGSYFLPRLPGRIGLYLALTGARLDGADCLYAGLATHFVPASRLHDLLGVLEAGPRGELSSVDAVLAGFATDPDQEAGLARQREAIDRCFQGAELDEVLARLAAEATPWAEQTAATIRAKSPTSQKVAFRQLLAGAALNFEDAMIMEYRLSQRFMAGHDFYEGVRAVVFDKDRTPAWEPDRLEAVTAASVDAYFQPLDHDLSFA
ncbi:MAG: enoyl-CoA hydratase/isomerase family protein [Alphaproteobacteria bacterium]